MKKIIFFVIVTINLLFNKLSAQNVSDTIFLLKEKSGLDIHNIFIDPNKDSKNYDLINNFNVFQNILNTKKLKFLDIPNKWIPLYIYHKNYYLYLPCDCFDMRIGLTRHNILFEGCEITKHKIINLSKKNNLVYNVTYTNYNKKGYDRLEIHIIDKHKGIAIFKHIINKTEIYYQLMLDSNKARSFPIIVNDCRYSKTIEFEFETIDFKKILNNLGQ